MSHGTASVPYPAVFDIFRHPVIAGDVLQSENPETLKESVERDARRQELQKQITALQAKVRKEKQLNKQVKLNSELKNLKKELEEI